MSVNTKTIKINTTQNVTIDYELAPLRERAIALFLDTLLIFFFNIFFLTLVDGIFELGNWMSVFVGSLCLLFFFLYFFLCEILNSGQSLGKKLMSLKVVRLDGREPRWGDALLRSLFHFIDSLLSLGVVGSILIKSTQNSQRYGDMAASTTVIKLQSNTLSIGLKDILNIVTLNNYKPVYTQVQALPEADMLKIRQIIDRYQTLNNQAHLELMEDLVTHLMGIMELEKRPPNSLEFLKTLLKDYIVLTR